VRGGFVLRYDEIQGRLDKGGSYQLEILKLLCEIADTLLYIKDNDKLKEEPMVTSHLDLEKYGLHGWLQCPCGWIYDKGKICENPECSEKNVPIIKKRGRPPKGR